MSDYDDFKKRRAERMKEIKEFQNKLKTDKKFAKQWLKEQNEMLQQVKKELFNK